MTRSTRTIELDDEDWASMEIVGANLRSPREGTGTLHTRFCVAAHKGRPPEPKTVEVGGEILVLGTDGNWRSTNEIVWAYSGGSASDAYLRIYELEHPEATP